MPESMRILLASKTPYCGAMRTYVGTHVNFPWDWGRRGQLLVDGEGRCVFSLCSVLIGLDGFLLSPAFTHGSCCTKNSVQSARAHVSRQTKRVSNTSCTPFPPSRPAKPACAVCFKQVSAVQQQWYARRFNIMPFNQAFDGPGRVLFFFTVNYSNRFQVRFCWSSGCGLLGVAAFLVAPYRASTTTNQTCVRHPLCSLFVLRLSVVFTLSATS